MAAESLIACARRGLTLPLTVVAALLFAGSVHAGSAIYVEGGTDDDEDDASRFGLALSYELPYRFLETGNWYLGTAFEASASYWDARSGTTGNDSLFEGGLTGMLRYQRTPTGGLAPFVEAGTGPHVMSETGIANRDFDIRLAFASHVGAGFRMGSRGEWEFLYRFQHLSNAGLGDSNPGINFHLLRVGYWF